MADYLWHVTLTTGDRHPQPRSRMDSPSYPRIARLLREALAGDQPEILTGYSMMATAYGPNLLVTVLSGDTPMLTTAVAKQARQAPRLWRQMHETADQRLGPLATRADMPPAAPWIADRIEIGSALAMQVAAQEGTTDSLPDWTGAFSALIGWAWMEYDQ